MNRVLYFIGFLVLSLFFIPIQADAATVVRKYVDDRGVWRCVLKEDPATEECCVYYID